jgi:Malectin domain
MMNKVFAASLLLVLLFSTVHGEITRINCGSDSTVVVDKYGNSWMADKTYAYGTNGPWSVCPTLGTSIKNTELDNIYCSERYFLNNGGYKIPVSKGTYKVELLFTEITYNIPTIRIFNISVQGTVIEVNLDLTKTFGYLTAGNITTNVVIPGTTGTIDIFLKASKENPKLNGIVLTKATTNSTTPQYVTIPYYVNAGYNENYVDSKGRTWNADKYFTGGESLNKANDCSSIEETKLYCTERFATSTGKFDYKIPVPPGVAYTVNLHFAEFYFDSPGQRQFNVIVQGKTIVSKLDLITQVGYRNPYILSVKNITVSTASPYIVAEFTKFVENAKLSGIEIIKFVDTPEVRLAAPIRINAGADKNWVEPTSKNVWLADKYFSGGSVYGTTVCNNTIDGTHLGILACSERYFFGIGVPNTVSGSYMIPMATGKYIIKLLFVEIFFPGGIRTFTVKIQNKVVLSNFDISASVGKDNALIISRAVSVLPSDPGITIEFTNIKENAKINAIEILSQRIGSLERGMGN